MFNRTGILSQTRNVVDTYEQTVRAKTPLIYFPLHVNTQTQNSSTGLWGYVNYTDGFTFNSYTYTSLPKTVNSYNPILRKNSSPATSFTTYQDKIVIPRSVDSRFNLQSNKTIEMWVYFREKYATSMMSDEYDSSADWSIQQTIGTFLVGSDIKLVFGIFKVPAYSWTRFYSTMNVQENTIYHLVFTWSTTELKMYVNGALDSTHNITGHMFSKTIGRILIGSNFANSTSTSSVAFHNPISDFAIYNRVLTLSEVQENYNAGVIGSATFPTPASSLPSTTILYLRGDSLNDLSAYPKHLVPYRRELIASNSPNSDITLLTDESVYGSNGSMRFWQIPTSYLKFGAKINNISLGNGTWTIEMWIKKIDFTSFNHIIQLLSFTPPDYNANNTLINNQFFLANFASNLSLWEHNGGTRTINNFGFNQWNHLAICRIPGNQISMFLNGTRFFNGSYNIDNSKFTELYLGAKCYGNAEETNWVGFKLAHLHIATTHYYVNNFTPNKATGFS